MRQFLVLLLVVFPIGLFGQTRNVNYGNWVSSKDSIQVQLVGNDIDTVRFSFRSLRSDPDPTESTLNPPDDVYWSGDGFLVIYPAVAGDGDLESDSLKAWLQPIDENGSIIEGPKIFCDWSAAVSEWIQPADSANAVLNWAAGKRYGCSLGGAFPPCAGFAAMFRQYASADTTNLPIKLFKD